MTERVRKHHKNHHRKSLIAWPSYTGKAANVGSSQSGRVTVFVDPSLGQDALRNAQDLLKDADRIVQANDTFFGVKGGHANVIVFALGGATDGTGGADHMSCDFVSGSAIEVCASFGQSTRVSALFEAEYSECAMNGNLCGSSTGESLSRWCAAAVSQNALSDFASAPTWDQNGRANWVDKTEPTDQDYDSIGCGMAFLSWLQAGKTLSQIAQAMVALGDSGTLAELYANLTGRPKTQAWFDFTSALAAAGMGARGSISSDDPFKILAAAQRATCDQKSHRLEQKKIKK